MAVNFPALAHLVTVLGSTLKSAATSAGVKSTSWLGKLFCIDDYQTLKTKEISILSDSPIMR